MHRNTSIVVGEIHCGPAEYFYVYGMMPMQTAFDYRILYLLGMNQMQIVASRGIYAIRRRPVF